LCQFVWLHLFGFGIGIERYIDLFAYPEEVGKLADFDHFGVKASLVAIL